MTNQVEFAELAYKLITACQSSNYGNLKFVRIYQEIDNCSRSLCVYAKDYIDATQELRVEQVKEILSK